MMVIAVLFFLRFSAAGQTSNLRAAEVIACRVPRQESLSTTGISKFFSQNLDRPADRVRACYYWVTHNIRYDRDSMYAINAGPDPQSKIREAMRRGKGVCENFAAIFTDLCRKCGVTSYTVDGYTSDGSKVNKAGHSWSAVLLNGRWVMCDPTWDEGYKNEPRFFGIAPLVFISEHLPFDPIWQLTDELVTPAEFYGVAGKHSKFNSRNPYLDSLPAFLGMDELEQYRQTARRMRTAGIESELAKIRLAYINMKIGIGYEDRDVDLYNAAVNDYNQALRLLNTYISFRNAQFLPRRPDKDIAGMISPIGDIILSAMQKLHMLSSTPEQYQTDASLLNSKLSALNSKLQDQERFLGLYLGGTPAVREKLFYTTIN